MHNIISSMGFDFISKNGLSLMSKFTRDQAKSNKNNSFIVALDYKNSQKSFYTLHKYTLKEIFYEIYTDGGSFVVILI